jgi:hypothetical protein
MTDRELLVESQSVLCEVITAFGPSLIDLGDPKHAPLIKACCDAGTMYNRITEYLEGK